MQLSRRWLDWTPDNRNSVEQATNEKCPSDLLPKMTKPPLVSGSGVLSVLSVPTLGDSRNEWGSAMPPTEPDAWREPFAKWLAQSCAEHPRCSGGLNVLHRAYSDWELAHDGVPCPRDVFIVLLMERKFRLIDVQGTALVAGLGLCQDIDLFFSRRTATKATNARRSAA